MARLALTTTADPADCFDGGNSLLGLVGPGLRPTSAVVYRRDVADFLARWPKPELATRAKVMAYLDSRAADNPAGWDRRAAALRHFFERGIAAGLWSTNPAAELPRARRGDWRRRR
jgi:site-specific recombinase XerD